LVKALIEASLIVYSIPKTIFKPIYRQNSSLALTKASLVYIAL
jgi:hypothetical protein